MEILVLAGGLGTRLRTVVQELPKPLAPVDGKPFLEYLLRYWIDQGVTSIVLSVGYRGDLIIDHFENQFCGVPVKYLIESKPLGTGGAILKYFDEQRPQAPFIVINGDTIFKIRLQEFIRFHQDMDSLLSIAAFSSSDTDRYSGIKCDKVGRLISFNDDVKGYGAQMICNGGGYMIDPRLITYLPNFDLTFVSFEKTLIPMVLEKGCRCYAKLFNDDFLDIGIPDDYKKSSDFFI